MSLLNSKLNRGMTAIELVIVIGIFAIIASVSFLSYSQFQDKVNLKNLANDIALKISEAQKSGVSGTYNASFCSTCNPAYGVVFNINAPNQFIYFADFDKSNTCNSSGCTPPYAVGGEVLSISSITSGTAVRTTPSSGLEVSGTSCPATVNNFTIIFRRPNSSPVFTSSPSFGCTPYYLGVNLVSPKGLTSRVRIFASGRLQMN